jgi:uncharacterized membrane protein YdjX (TVP38/TMEM64 family)
MIATLIMLITDGIFSISAVNDWFSGLITGSSGVLVYIAIWLIMFLQVTILNIPAYVILSASVSVGINTLSVTYILVVLSAYMCGCVLAYWLGKKFGKSAVKWCAGSEEDYNKWSTVLNEKGKWWYFATVIFPMFPDDILCIVAGAVKFDFKFYLFSNFIGRGVGLVTTLLCLKLLSMGNSNFPFTVILWAVALICEAIIYFVLKHKEKKNEFDSDRK